jgi:transglutaminase-like putative cysteine protease
LTVLFSEVCRAVGLASRFVSGYYALPDDDGQRHLHAWSEVYVPGAGWRGFDPGLGLAVSDHHVAVAAGSLPWAAAPIVGSFRGNDAISSLDTELEIELS